ncbi:hypothetical protein MMC29_005109 [Sticta canariensis]|nr:hypothetical protein [Sticta canariensis]
MVLPGWNVTEPLEVAAKIYTIVRAYRDADGQIQSFASQVSIFCTTLRALDECLKNPDATPLDDNDPLKIASDGCRRCAENCQSFVEDFLKQNDLPQPNAKARQEGGPGRRLQWIWRKDQATALAEEMGRQISYIGLNLNIAERKDRQRQNSTAAGLGAPAGSAIAAAPKPLENIESTEPNDSFSQPRTAHVADPKALTPLKLFSQANANPIPFSMSHESEAPVDLESRQFSLTEHVPWEIVQRRGSNFSHCASSNAIMDNLTGVTIYRKTENGKPLPVQKLEFLKDLSGSLLYIIATLPAGYQAKLFHQIPPSSQVIPHTEHPTAYKNRKVLLIKFLDPHQLTSERWSASANTPSLRAVSTSSIRSFSIASPDGTPETLPSSASISDSTSNGSPLLLPNTSKFEKETKYPKYEFEDEKDYRIFQEHVFGKDLLANVPINTIASKYFNSSKAHLQCETQRLRLWSGMHSQTLMYYANCLDKPKYVEHNTQFFRINESKSDSTILCLETQQSAELQSTSTKRKGSVKSIFSSPSLSPKSLRKATQGDATSPESEVSQYFDNLSCLVIKFTEARGCSRLGHDMLITQEVLCQEDADETTKTHALIANDSRIKTVHRWIRCRSALRHLHEQPSSTFHPFCSAECCLACDTLQGANPYSTASVRMRRTYRVTNHCAGDEVHEHSLHEARLNGRCNRHTFTRGKPELDGTEQPPRAISRLDATEQTQGIMRSELDVGELSVRRYVDLLEARGEDAERSSEPDVGNVGETRPASQMEAAVVDSRMRSKPNVGGQAGSTKADNIENKDFK